MNTAHPFGRLSFLVLVVCAAASCAQSEPLDDPGSGAGGSGDGTAGVSGGSVAGNSVAGSSATGMAGMPAMAGSSGSNGTAGSAGSTGIAGSASSTGPGGSAGGTTPTFTQVYVNILTPYCAGSSCHSPGKKGSVSFASQATAYASLTSKLTPGDGATSTLYTIVNSGRMPEGKAKLSAANIAMIKAWIDAGALDN